LLVKLLDNNQELGPPEGLRCPRCTGNAGDRGREPPSSAADCWGYRSSRGARRVREEIGETSTSLVMKGSPVRVRASAFPPEQVFSALTWCRSEGFRGPPEVYLGEVLKEKSSFAGLFRRQRADETPVEIVISSHSECPQSGLTPSVVMKESRLGPRSTVDSRIGRDSPEPSPGSKYDPGLPVR
jgi:hypothetical protein